MSDAWKQWEGHVVDGRFPLREFQGSTDHSAVFVTSFGSLQEKAALKLLPYPAAGGVQPLLQRWERTAQLTHPHLLRLLACGTCKLSDAQFLYVVSEFADENLAQILPGRPLSAQEAEFMLRSTLEVLVYLHAAGLVHAGLKPANLMAVGDSLKLSSDSICSPADRGATPRLPSVYDAPELASTGPSAAADVWSLGITLVEALSQKVSPRAAFREGDALLPEGTPPLFLEMARQCLRLDPQRRWTPQEIASRLLPSSPPAPSKARLVAAAAAVLALAAILVAGKFWRQTPSPKGNTTFWPIQAQVQQPVPAATPAPTPAAPSAAVPVKNNPPLASIRAAAERVPDSAPSKTVPGAVLEKVLPKVSDRSLGTITGKLRVSVQLAVDTSGRVTEATLASPGPSPYFARVALDAAQGWTFTPPAQQGQAVASNWMLRFAFTREGVEVQPVQLSP